MFLALYLMGTNTVKRAKKWWAMLVWMGWGVCAHAAGLECEFSATVVPSSQFATPTLQYTSQKNDGFPMLLIGVNIDAAKAVGVSSGLKKHQAACLRMVGSRQDVYLSGQHAEQDWVVGQQVCLRYRHISGRADPFWADGCVLLPP